MGPGLRADQVGSGATLPSIAVDRVGAGHDGSLQFVTRLSGRVLELGPRPFSGSNPASWDREVASNAVLDPIFLAIADVTPGFLRTLVTAATCSSASTGNTARISLSPV